MKFLLKILKKIVISFGIIYLFDVVLSGTNVIIPINISTIIVGTLLGIPGIVSLIIINIFI